MGDQGGVEEARKGKQFLQLQDSVRPAMADLIALELQEETLRWTKISRAFQSEIQRCGLTGVAVEVTRCSSSSSLTASKVGSSDFSNLGCCILGTNSILIPKEACRSRLE